MIAKSQDILDLLRKKRRTKRQTAADSLRSRYHVGIDAVMHIRIKLACASVSRLHLIDHQNDIVFFCIVGDRTNEIGAERVYTALSLNAFEENARYLMRFHRFVKCLDVIRGGVYKSGREGLKQLVIMLLTRCRKGGQGSAVKAIFKLTTVLYSAPFFSAAYFRATLIAHSFASAPEFEKKTFFIPVFLHRSCASFPHGSV